MATATLTRSVEVSIAEFTDDEVKAEAKHRGFLRDQADLKLDEKVAARTKLAEARERFDFLEKVIDEIRRGYEGEAVFLLERERDRIRPSE